MDARQPRDGGVRVNDFTASNGLHVLVDGFGDVLVKNDSESVSPDARVYDALREFFRAEEDERLGRWRWPENPDYVVYREPDEDGDNCIVRESDGDSAFAGRGKYARDQYGRPMYDEWDAAAAAYFDAHPEPKPWDTASPGEAWLITWGNGSVSEPAIVTIDGDFDTVNHRVIKRREVIGARRIWPEVSA